MEELLARIRAILHRSSKARVETNYHKYENGPITLCVEKRQVLIAGREVHFADTEFQLLAILLKDPGVIHTHVELLRKVWGPESIGEVHLRVAFARLRRKFEEAGLEGG
ncbi:MAG: response regulator transcription factor [Sutterella wadsworthensis]